MAYRKRYSGRNKVKKNALADTASAFLELIKGSNSDTWVMPWDMLNSRNPLKSIGDYEYRGNFARAYLSYLSYEKYDGCMVWGNFKQLGNRGLGPVKGSGIGIPRPFFKKERNENTGEEESKIAFWGTTTVFNLLPCDGIETGTNPETGKKHVTSRTPGKGREMWEEMVAKQRKKGKSKNVEIGDIDLRLKTFFEKNETEFSQGGHECYYSGEQGKVQMPFPEFFEGKTGTTPSDEYYRALFHECGHAIQRRLAIRVDSQKSDNAYPANEVSAEVTALLVSKSLGIEVDLTNSVHYSTGWANKFDKDPALLSTAVSNGIKCAEHILEDMGFDLPKEESFDSSKEEETGDDDNA